MPVSMLRCSQFGCWRGAVGQSARLAYSLRGGPGSNQTNLPQRSRKTIWLQPCVCVELVGG
eukprot:SAG31_NODE_34416_length_333_cov_0.803419_1_plen_60_part_01